MELNQILNVLQQTYANEWQEVHPVDVKGHDYRIVYRPDVALSVAWGTTVNNEYSDGWVERFKDKKASSHVAEIMYNGAVDFIRLLDEIVQGPHGEYDSYLQTAEFRVL